MAILSAQVETAWQNLQGKSDLLLAAAEAPVARIRGIANTAQQAASSLTQRAADAVNIAQSVTGLASEVTAQAFELGGATASIATSAAASLQLAADRTGNLGSIKIDGGIGADITLARDQQAVLDLCRQLADLADQITAAAEKALADVEPYVVYAMRGETLRDIALRELGSASAWRDIAMVNGLSGSEVVPGLPLLIPRQKQANTPS
jgi:nucleoid-associated protein YgaU